MKKYLLTIDETCTLLRISKPTIHRMMRKGELEPVKIGNRTLFRVSDIEKMIGDTIVEPEVEGEPSMEGEGDMDDEEVETIDYNQIWGDTPPQ